MRALGARRALAWVLGLVALVVAGALLAACDGVPRTYLVTVTVDGADVSPGDGRCEVTPGEGDCSLRAAIDEINAGGDITSVTLPAGTYLLDLGGTDDDNDGGDLDVVADGRAVTIAGHGHGGARIDAAGAEAVLEAHAGSITLIDVGITGADGPGVVARTGVELALVRSTSWGNTGAGVTGAPGAAVTVLASTLSTNDGAGVVAQGDLSVRWSTVTGNGGGGIAGAGTPSLEGSVVAAQAAGDDCAAVVGSSGHNLASDGSCGLGGPTDQTGPAELGPLSDDRVPHHVPLPGSPVLDAAPGTACEGADSLDQRSTRRPVGDGCDLGAIERAVDGATSTVLSVTSTDDLGDGAPGDGVCAAGAAGGPPPAPPTVDDLDGGEVVPIAAQGQRVRRVTGTTAADDDAGSGATTEPTAPSGEPPVTSAPTAGPSSTSVPPATDAPPSTTSSSTSSSSTTTSSATSPEPPSAPDSPASLPAPGSSSTTSTTAPSPEPPEAAGLDAPNSGPCTLRAAVQEANALAAAAPGHRTEIRLLPGATHALTLGAAGEEDAAIAGDLDVRAPIEVFGLGGRVSAEGLPDAPDHRVFDVHAGGSLRLVEVGVTGGRTTGDGGGVRLVAGSLSAERITLWANRAGGDGGGIAALDGAAGACRQVACTVDTSTIAGNQARRGAGVTTAAALELSWTTVAGNASTEGSAESVLARDVVTLRGALVSAGDERACTGLVVVPITSVASDASCERALDVDGELVWDLDEDGPLPFHPATWEVERAVVAADAAVGDCPGVDQVGASRPSGAACDAGATESTDIVVTSVQDAVDATPGDERCDGPHDLCTLRAAIDLANARPGHDHVVLTPGERYELSLRRDPAGPDAESGDLDVRDDATIVGNGATVDAGWRPDPTGTASQPGLATIAGVVTDEASGEPLSGILVRRHSAHTWWEPVTTDAAGRFRIVDVDPGAYHRLRFDDPTGRHLREYWDGASTLGAATFVPVAADAVSVADAALALDPAAPPGTEQRGLDDWGADDRVLEVAGGARVEVRDLEVVGGSTVGDGGGVRVTDGELVASRSTFHHNMAAGAGGGVHVEGASLAELRQATVSHNRATDGAGVATTSTGSLVLDWSTVADNGSFGGGGGVHMAGPTVLRGSIVAHHRDLDRIDGVAPDCTSAGAPVVTVEEVNLDTWVGPGGGTCGLPAAMTVDPAVHGRLLGPLDDLVGPTPTHGLRPEVEDVVAEVIGVGVGTCPPTDQRHLPRNRVRADLAGAHPDLCEPGAVEFAPWLVVEHNDDAGDDDGDGACTPTPTTDGCRLRAAVMEANRYPGPDVIVMHHSVNARLTIPGADEHAAATGDLDVTDDLVVLGHGATVDARPSGDRAFEVRDGAELRLEDLEVIGGGPVLEGGGISVPEGRLHLQGVTVEGGDADEGAGVHLGAGAGASHISRSTISGGTAARGAGIATRSPEELVVAWTTVSANVGGGLLVGGPVRTAGVLVVDQAAGSACTVDGGRVASEGASVLGDAECAGEGDVVDADAELGPLEQQGGPTRTHVVAPASGLVDLLPAAACGGRDQHVVVRPQGAGCEPGAVEHVDGGSSYELVSFMAPPSPEAHDDLDEDSDGARALVVDPEISVVHASRLVASHYLDDAVGGDRSVEALLNRGFPPFEDPSSPYPRNGWGEFAFPQLLRLEVIEQPPTWVDNRYRDTVRTWGQRFADQECDLAADFGSATDPDPWERPGDSEGHSLMRRTSCVLALYGFGAPGEWEPWADAVGSSLAVRARTGVFEEFDSPTYVRHFVASLVNLVDLPEAPGTTDDLLRQRATHYLDLHYHLVAHQYEPSSGVAGTSGVRLYQPDPDAPDPDKDGPGNIYAHPGAGWVGSWARLYGWAELVDPGPGGNRLTINGAVSDYRPRDVSRRLAVATDTEFTAAFARPGLVDVPAVDADHQIVQRLEVTPGHRLGAQTYGPGDGMHRTQQNVFFTVTFDGTAYDRIVVSGVGDHQGSSDTHFSDQQAINGVVHGGVLVASPDTRAHNVVGPDQRIRLYLGSADLRANLVEAGDGWFYTHDGAAGDPSSAEAFVAARTTGTPLVICDAPVQAPPCSSPELRREIRSDGAVVVQVVAADELDDGDPGTDDFAGFVTSFADGRWSAPTGGATAASYRSLAEEVFEFEPEWDEETDITIDGAPASAQRPSSAYTSPYFCDLDADPSSPQVLGLRGPGDDECADVVDFRP